MRTRATPGARRDRHLPACCATAAKAAFAAHENFAEMRSLQTGNVRGGFFFQGGDPSLACLGLPAAPSVAVIGQSCPSARLRARCASFSSSRMVRHCLLPDLDVASVSAGVALGPCTFAAAAHSHRRRARPKTLRPARLRGVPSPPQPQAQLLGHRSRSMSPTDSGRQRAETTSTTDNAHPAVHGDRITRRTMRKRPYLARDGTFAPRGIPILPPRHHTPYAAAKTTLCCAQRRTRARVVH